MSVIAVRPVPMKWSLTYLVKILVKTINGQFEALNFVSNKKRTSKTAYLRLSEKLDPLQVIERINNGKFSSASLHAFVPDHVPDLPLAAKLRTVPRKLARSLKLPTDLGLAKMLMITHGEILQEMQTKYTGLYNLSRKTGQKLLQEIAQTIFERLKHIMETNTEASESCFKWSKCYRKTYPHFGDFQLILSTLHRVQDAAGIPRAQIQEHELAAVDAQPYVINNIPFNKIQLAINKYSERIVNKVTDHIEHSNSNINVGKDGEEEIARKKVREELKKLVPYLPTIVKQVVGKHLVPEKKLRHKIRIYGEPFMPTKEQMSVFMRGRPGLSVSRSEHMYNLLRLASPPQHFAPLLAMDGTVVGGAKLIIRSADIPLYKIPDSLKAQMSAAFGAEQQQEGDEGEEAYEAAFEDAMDDDPDTWTQWT